jgi:hypothetical protein
MAMISEEVENEIIARMKEQYGWSEREMMIHAMEEVFMLGYNEGYTAAIIEEGLPQIDVRQKK